MERRAAAAVLAAVLFATVTPQIPAQQAPGTSKLPPRVWASVPGMSASVPASVEVFSGDPIEYGPIVCEDRDWGHWVGIEVPVPTVPGAVSPEFDFDTTVPLPTIASAPEGTWRLDLNGGHPEKWTFRAPRAIETLVDTVVYDRYRFDDTGAVPEGDTGSRDDPQMPEAEGLYLTVMVTVRAKVGYIAGIVLEQGKTPRDGAIAGATVTVSRGYDPVELTTGGGRFLPHRTPGAWPVHGPCRRPGVQRPGARPCHRGERQDTDAALPARAGPAP